MKRRMCDEENETQDHILAECQGIHEDETTKVTTSDIFKEDIDTLKAQARKIENIMEKLKNTDKNQMCSSPDDAVVVVVVTTPWPVWPHVYHITSAIALYCLVLPYY